jgi:hypothetical protein
MHLHGLRCPTEWAAIPRMGLPHVEVDRGHMLSAPNHTCSCRQQLQVGLLASVLLLWQAVAMQAATGQALSCHQPERP